MTQKRFIKLMRMLRYPRHLINKAVNTVKLRGGSLSYYDYFYKLAIYKQLFGYPVETAISRFEKQAKFYAECRRSSLKIVPVARNRKFDGIRKITIIDEWTGAGGTEAKNEMQN